MRSTTLCLNMIVKNEGNIILRLLNSVVSIIDSYCICDTGSTDNTPSIIQAFFADACIPGKIVHEPFRDFGYNRTVALHACAGEAIQTGENEPQIPFADYILLLDADMVFWLNPATSPQQFKESLTHDVYMMFQGNDNFYYKNARIIKNGRGCSYWGVTHEYLKMPDNSTQQVIQKADAFIIDIGDGGSKTNKYERDIRLLKQGLIDLPNNDRYTFYLANTYYDSGMYDLAIATYQDRTKLGGWHEEVWQSFYRIGCAYEKTGRPELAISAWLDAYNVFPNRIENLYEIVKYYRVIGKHQLSYTFYELANRMRTQYPGRDYLFTHKCVYDYKLDYEFSIIAYYTNPAGIDMAHFSMDVAKHSTIEDSILRNILSNYKFYTTALIDIQDVQTRTELCKMMETFAETNIPEGFVASTPSICHHTHGSLVLNVRYVNYRIDDEGNYVNQPTIDSINRYAILDMTRGTISTQGLVLHNRSVDNRYVGLEDVRLFLHQGRLLYNANRGLSDPDSDAQSIKVEHGQIDTTWGKTTSTILKKKGEHTVEKNWVLCSNGAGDLHCVYGWHPLNVGKISPESIYHTTYTQKMPAFFKHVRGSSNGSLWGDELWFLCHTVSYESRRYYYHLFVVLDANTFALKKYTPWFTFEKKPVEYSLGFVFYSGAVLIGYSLMDRCTKFITVNKSHFDKMMIEHS
jgi:glycosyltransferase involved in cell wall biosynthesis